MKRNVARVVACVFLMSLFAGSLVCAQEKSVQLRFSTFFPPSHELWKVTAEWCKEVEKRTAGRVRIRHYPGGTLTAPAQTYDSIVQGVVDAGNCVLGYTMGKFPLSEVLDYPLGYPNGTAATHLMNAYYAKFKPKELDEVKVMYFHGQTPGILHTKKPVAKLEDLKGMKIRTYGSTARMIALLGGTPVAMPMGDSYDAISKGVCDGIAGAYEILDGWKLGEVIKYTTEDYGIASSATFVVVMNKAKWNAISPQDQKAIEQINQEWIEKQAQVWAGIDDGGRKFSAKRGNKVITLSAEENARWAQKVEPLFDEYVKNMKARGLPGDQVLRFARDFLKNTGK